VRAVVLDRPGGPEVLSVREVPAPEPGPGEVCVRVAAAGVNRLDAKIRADPASRRVPLPAILGYEAAGTVEVRGAGVLSVAAGDPVFFSIPFLGNPRGTYAERVPVRAEFVAPAPRGIPPAEAAAVPLAGGTAWEAVVRRLRLVPGETILIVGASGAVGSLAVQFAKLAGARVLAVASEGRRRFLEQLGADVTIDYAREDLAARALEETGGIGVDAALDAVGGATVRQVSEAVRPFGRVATILGFAGEFPRFYTKNLTLHGVLHVPERARLEAIRPLLEAHRLRLPVARFSLESVREVHERLDSGHAEGKMVLEPG
jgi:NADPH:quinone reductase